MKKQRIVYLLPLKIKRAVKLHRFLIMGIIMGIALLACSKEERIEASVEGRVTTYGSNDAASKEPVTIELAQLTARGVLAGGQKLVATTETNSDGYFRFEWTAEDVTHYLRVKSGDTPPLHYAMTPVGFKFQPGKNITKNIELTALAWVRLRVINTDPQPGDLFSVNFGGGYSPNFYGPADEEFIADIGANFYKKLHINLRRNDEWHIWTDSVYAPAFDTVYHTIEY